MSSGQAGIDRDGPGHLGELGRAEQPAAEQCPQEAVDIAGGRDERRVRVDHHLLGHVHQPAGLERLVRAGARARQHRRVSRPDGVVQAERPDDPVADLVVPRPAGDPLDDHVEQDVTGAGVAPRRARCEVRPVTHRPGDQLLRRVDVETVPVE
jgi:hypothetical protein